MRFSEIQRMTDHCGIEIDDIQFISGGKTNESYLVSSVTGQRFLARIAGSGTERFIDRDKEKYNVLAATRIGVAPKLLCAMDNNLLIDYIDGECSSGQELLYLDDNMDKLTRQLCTLHESSEPFKGEFSFIHDFHLYKKDYVSTGCSIPITLRKCEEELYTLVKWVDETYNKCKHPVHSDLVLQNCIFTKERAYIIDWEYSTMADRYLDLASFCTQNILGAGADKMFLKSYFKHTREDFDYGKFLLFKMSISFMWIYWHLNNVAHNKDAKYNEYRWRMHLNNTLVCKEEWENFLRTPTKSDQPNLSFH